jgi:hypothetical protein
VHCRHTCATIRKAATPVLLPHHRPPTCLRVVRCFAYARACRKEPSRPLAKHLRLHSRTHRFNSARTSGSCNSVALFTCCDAIRFDPPPPPVLCCTSNPRRVAPDSTSAWVKGVHRVWLHRGSSELVTPDRRLCLPSHTAAPPASCATFLHTNSVAACARLAETPPCAARSRSALRCLARLLHDTAGPALAPALPHRSRARPNRVRSWPASCLAYTARLLLARCHVGPLLLARCHAASFAPAPPSSRAAHAFAPRLPHACAALASAAASSCAASPLLLASAPPARTRPRHYSTLAGSLCPRSSRAALHRRFAPPGSLPRASTLACAPEPAPQPRVNACCRSPGFAPAAPRPGAARSRAAQAAPRSPLRAVLRCARACSHWRQRLRSPQRSRRVQAEPLPPAAPLTAARALAAQRCRPVVPRGGGEREREEKKQGEKGEAAGDKKRKAPG